MKTALRKLGIVAVAATMMGVGINGLGLAAAAEPTAEEMGSPALPRQIEKMADELALSEEQLAKLQALHARKQALQDEFWAVFTEEQKTTMLKASMKKHKKHRGDKSSRQHHNKGKRKDKQTREENA